MDPYQIPTAHGGYTVYPDRIIPRNPEQFREIMQARARREMERDMWKLVHLSETRDPHMVRHDMVNHSVTLGCTYHEYTSYLLDDAAFYACFARILAMPPPNPPNFGNAPPMPQEPPPAVPPPPVEGDAQVPPPAPAAPPANENENNEEFEEEEDPEEDPEEEDPEEEPMVEPEEAHEEGEHANMVINLDDYDDLDNWHNAPAGDDEPEEDEGTGSNVVDEDKSE